jgi:hypothetical protein
MEKCKIYPRLLNFSTSIIAVKVSHTFVKAVASWLRRMEPSTRGGSATTNFMGAAE